MNQPVKRRNPFETPLRQKETEPVQEEQKIEEETIIEENVVKEPQKVEEITPVEPTRQQVRVVKTVTKGKTSLVDDELREKYTATMEITLRRRIKIVCATRGIMFSEFIEDACREKLRREGER